jgi:hypothetical protein
MLALVTPTSSVISAVIVTVSVGSDVGKEMVVVLAERILIVGAVESTYDFWTVTSVVAVLLLPAASWAVKVIV